MDHSEKGIIAKLNFDFMKFILIKFQSKILLLHQGGTFSLSVEGVA